MDFNCTPVSAAFRSTLETRRGDTARVTACTHFKVDSVQAQNSAVLHMLYVREHMFYVRMMYHLQLFTLWQKPLHITSGWELIVGWMSGSVTFHWSALQ